MGKIMPVTVKWDDELKDYVCKSCGNDDIDMGDNFCSNCAEHLRFPKKLRKEWYLS